MASVDRAGAYMISTSGARCFKPKPLPPAPPVEMTGALTLALSDADRAIARLDGSTLILPDTDLFVYGFMLQEAALSSQIEGTQASLDDVLVFQAEPRTVQRTEDVADVVNYIHAMNWGMDELARLPLSLRFVRELHGRLLRDGRGADRKPGEFRTTQNWIGAPGSTIEEAVFVPPAVPDMTEALGHWEAFLHHDHGLPPLIRSALAHAQFETIHPFLDGNGRVGRMIVALMLVSDRVLHRPLLYLSMFFKKNRGEYYDLLQAIRQNGDWERWLLFFLRGVDETARSAFDAAQSVIKLKERIDSTIRDQVNAPSAAKLGHLMFRYPYLSARQIAERLGVSQPTANALVRRFSELKFLTEVSGRKWGRLYAFSPYLRILRAIETD